MQLATFSKILEGERQAFLEQKQEEDIPDEDNLPWQLLEPIRDIATDPWSLAQQSIQPTYLGQHSGKPSSLRQAKNELTELHNKIRRVSKVFWEQVYDTLDVMDEGDLEMMEDVKKDWEAVVWMMWSRQEYLKVLITMEKSKSQNLAAE